MDARDRCWLRALAAQVALGVLAGCGHPAAAPPVREAAIVTVANPLEIEVVDNYYFEGYTAAVSTVDVRARVTGYLSKIYFQDGQDVKEGAPLFLIDPRPYQAQLDQAASELARVEATLKRLEAEYARAEKLLPKRNISQEDFDKIAAERAETAADIKSRQAQVEQAKLNLHFAAIKSPIDGRISRRLVTEGNLVTANETLLTTIVSTAPIYAYFDVDEPTVLRIRQKIREGKIQDARQAEIKVWLALDIDNGYPYEGIIDFVENRVDPKTGTLKVRAKFANKNNALSPGLHARIKLPMGEPHKELAISERAIGSTQGQKYVFLVNEENRVVEQPVTLGSLENNLRVIAAGLKPADRVIINGLQRVREGATVNPRTSEATTAEGALTPVSSVSAKQAALTGESPRAGE
jgi:RND family efflux transporter MFP subunit